MSKGTAMLYDVGYDVFAEIVAGIRVARVPPQLIEKKLRVEHIDSHTGQRFVRFPWHCRRICRLLEKRPYDVVLVHVDNAESARFRSWHFQAANSDVRSLAYMLLQHDLVIHLVDVIAGKQHDVSGRVTLNDIDILIHRVRRA